MTHFDLAIIGTGSGNMIVDDRFADRRVAILEQGLFGGTCLNVGCIPTKMFVYPAEIARAAMHGPALGVDTHVDGVRWEAIRDRVFQRIDPIAANGKAWRKGLPNHTVYDGHARFVGERTLDTGTGEVISADQVVVAAGSRATLPSIPGIDDVVVHTSDTVMRLPRLPGTMLIIGGGVVAAELAHVFSAYGVEVVQVHRGERLLSRLDGRVAERFTESAARQWSVRLTTGVDRLHQEGPQVVADLSDGSTVRADVVLVATGRVSNADRLDVAAAGIATDEHGVVVVDDYQRTNVEGVWALGDIANHYQLKHVANHEARVIQHNLLHPDAMRRSDHRFVPAAVFSSPQVATVGMTEEQARASGTPYVVVVQQYADVAYGWAMEDTEHFVKLLATPDTGHLLGAHLLGPQASILIQPLLAGMAAGDNADKMAHSQYWIHPALAEVVENALLKCPHP